MEQPQKTRPGLKNGRNTLALDPDRCYIAATISRLPVGQGDLGTECGKPQAETAAHCHGPSLQPARFPGLGRWCPGPTLPAATAGLTEPRSAEADAGKARTRQCPDRGG